MTKKPVPSQKAWYTSNTMQVAMLELFIAAGLQTADYFEAGEFTVHATILLLVGIAGIVLRMKTKQSVTWSKIDVDPEDVLEPEK